MNCEEPVVRSCTFEVRFHLLEPGKDQVIFYSVLICKTLELKEGVLSFSTTVDEHIKYVYIFGCKNVTHVTGFVIEGHSRVKA